MWRLLALAPLVLLLAACGGSSGKSGSSSAGAVLQTIQISEKEYSLTPSTAGLPKTGTYAFRATNDGQVAHALEIQGNGVEQKTGEIQPGSSATLRVTLSKEGSYEIYCPIDGHKQEGMSGTVTVGDGGVGGGGTTTQENGTTTSGAPGY